MMKKLLRNIAKNKFEVIFFTGLACLLIVSIVFANVTETTSNNIEPHTEIPINDNNVIDDNNGNTPVVQEVEEIKTPIDANLDYQVVRKFYEQGDTKENIAKSLIKYENTFRTSNGVSYGLKNGEYFDVLSSISGKVVDVANSPMYGKYVVIASGDSIKTYYYGLSDISVTVGSTISQGQVLGKAGTSTVDQETGIHVYFKITKDGKYLNPEKVIGSKIDNI